jgi:hypothetical protein
MPHCEIDDLALLALGEEVAPDVSEHVSACPVCAAQLQELREVVVMGKASGGPSSLVEPPQRVWEAVSAEIQEPVAEVVPIRTRRRWLGLAAAAVAGVVLGAGVMSVADRPDEGRIVASAALKPMPDGPDRGATAEAEVHQTAAGYAVTVSARDLPGAQGFYEVWLLDPENAGLIALGTLAPGETTATFPVPDGVDLQTFTAVDISDEPLDGDPGHSTVTVLRGTLA